MELVEGPTLADRIAGGDETPLAVSVTGSTFLRASDWTGDGKFLLLREGRGQRVYAVPMDGSGDTFRWLSNEVFARDGKCSPDGRWVAYASLESGRFEIYLQSFPQAGRKFTVSRDGGMWPQWRADR